MLSVNISFTYISFPSSECFKSLLTYTQYVSGTGKQGFVHMKPSSKDLTKEYQQVSKLKITPSVKS